MTNETQATEVQDVEVPFDVPEGYKLVSDAEMEQLASQLVETHQEKWEIQEIVDNAVAAGELNALMRNEFLYEFKQGGRTVRGLTAAMIAHLATARGIGEITEEREYRGDDPEATHHEFTVVVEGPDPFNPDRMLKRTGFSEEPKILRGEYDRFAKQKAYTKAFRNACLKLLPQDLIIAAIYKLAKMVPVDWAPNPQPRALPPAQNGATAGNGNQADAATQNSEKAAFASYNDRAEQLDALGITKDIFWAGVKAHFKVKSRTEMTAEQYQQLREDLNVKDFAQWIRDLAPKKTETQTAETEKEADPQF